MFGLLMTSVSSSCPFGSSLNAGTCVCLPGYTSSGSGASLVCTSLCPVGSNCVVISKRTTSGEEYINLNEVELYLGTTKLATSSLSISMSSLLSMSSIYAASECNDGVTNGADNFCHTAAGDRNAWLLINAGSQSFSRVVVYNRGTNDRIDVATLTMFNGVTVTTPAVTFSSIGLSLLTYSICYIGFNGSTCASPCLSNNYYNFSTNTCVACPPGSSSAAELPNSCTCLPGYTSSGSGASLVCTSLCPVGSNCAVISKRTTTGSEWLHPLEVELYLGATKLANSSLIFTLSSTWSENGIHGIASKCNDGVTSPSVQDRAGFENAMCSTANGDRDAWLRINAGTQVFSRVIVYNRNEACCQTRIDVATLTMFNGGNVTKPAVTFGSFGSGLATYTFCSTGLTGSTCINSCLSNSYYNFRTGACAACPLGSSSAAGAWSCSCLNGYTSSGSGSSLFCKFNSRKRIYKDFIFMDL